MTNPEYVLTGRAVLVLMVSFFAVIIGVNITLAVLANTSWTGLVVENGYVASQNFNNDLAEARREAALGWSEHLGYASGLLKLEVKDASGRPLSRLAVLAKLERPSTDKEDKTVELHESISGVYGLATELKPGQWDADVSARSPSGETLRRIYRLYVPVEKASQ